MTPISTDKAPSAIGPYSQAVKSNGFIFTSGQLPIDANGTMAGDTIEAQAEQVLANIAAILASQNLSKDAIIKTTVFLQDLQDFQQFNAVYEKFFGQHKPARSTIQVARLPLDAKIEIEATAQVD